MEVILFILYLVIGLIVGLVWEVYSRVYEEDQDQVWIDDLASGIFVGLIWPVCFVVAIVAGILYALNELVERWATNVKHVEKAREYGRYKGE